MVFFSYGVVVWEMLTGGHPYEDVVDGALMLKALTGQLTLSVPESIPKSYKELLCGKLTLRTNDIDCGFLNMSTLV